MRNSRLDDNAFIFSSRKGRNFLLVEQMCGKNISRKLTLQFNGLYGIHNASHLLHNI